MKSFLFSWALISLAVVAMFPVLLIKLAEYDGGFWNRLEKFIQDYQATLLSLGTLLLVSGLAVMTTIVANQYADRRDATNRKISAALKLSEYRQKWIDQLRNDFARLITISANSWQDGEGQFDLEKVNEAYSLVSSITLRVNPNDENYERLRELLVEVCNNAHSANVDASKIGDLRSLAHRMLKLEWDRLKNDLKSSQISREGEPK